MQGWLPKSLKSALIALVIAYIGFSIYCIVGYALTKATVEPIPSIIVGIPVALIIATVVFIFSAVRNSN
jgi:hypothetical protein